MKHLASWGHRRRSPSPETVERVRRNTVSTSGRKLSARHPDRHHAGNCERRANGTITSTSADRRSPSQLPNFHSDLLPPSHSDLHITKLAGEKLDQVLASTIGEPRAEAAGLASPDEVHEDPTASLRHHLINGEALTQARLSIYKGGYGLITVPISARRPTLTTKASYYGGPSWQHQDQTSSGSPHLVTVDGCRSGGPPRKYPRPSDTTGRLWRSAENSQTRRSNPPHRSRRGCVLSSGGIEAQIEEEECGNLSTNNAQQE